VARLVLDDLYLATACADGDNDAWREFERAHFAFIRDFAGRFLRGVEAEDLASTVIADLWQRRKIAQFQGRSTLRTWLGAVVTRMALNAKASARLRAAATASDLSAVDPSAPPEADDDEGRALARLMQRAIGRLDADDKVLLLFHYEQGLSLDAMAPLLGASKATLSRRIAAIRERLRQDVDALAAAERGPQGTESLRPAIPRAQAEFDLAELLGGARVKGGAARHV
jgi:RNA polymerase sigma-70 factor (ECF subfamily)